MKVEQLMNRAVVACALSDTMTEAAQRMWDHDCGALPVTDVDGRIVGIITDRDVCMAAYTQGRPLHEIAVTSAMSRDVVSCAASDDLRKVESLMRERKVRRLPVVDAELKVLGMISMSDLVRYADQRPRSSLDRELVSSLAEISAPRILEPGFPQGRIGGEPTALLAIPAPS